MTNESTDRGRGEQKRDRISEMADEEPILPYAGRTRRTKPLPKRAFIAGQLAFCAFIVAGMFFGYQGLVSRNLLLLRIAGAMLGLAAATGVIGVVVIFTSSSESSSDIFF
jgi:hypothetical protein